MKTISISIAIAVKKTRFMPPAIAVLSGPRLYSSAVNSYSFLTSTPVRQEPDLRQIATIALVLEMGLAESASAYSVRA